MKKEVVQQKSYFTAMQRFPSFRATRPFSFVLIFLWKTVNRKLTFMYLLALEMSNIKLEILAQECSKRMVFSKNLQHSLENSYVWVSLL